MKRGNYQIKSILKYTILIILLGLITYGGLYVYSLSKVRVNGMKEKEKEKPKPQSITCKRCDTKHYGKYLLY